MRPVSALITLLLVGVLTAPAAAQAPDGAAVYQASCASCQPRPSVHLIVTMWSVKWRPNPGLTRIASRSASDRGCEEGLSSIVGVVMSAVSFTGCL